MRYAPDLGGLLLKKPINISDPTTLKQTFRRRIPFSLHLLNAMYFNENWK